jgi:CheY-like chemotaxis protein
MNAFKRQGRAESEKIILLAEDHPLNQKVALLLLERMGFDAHVAANGIKAVEAAKRVHYGAILMDCHMPEMDGFDATREIRKHELVVGWHVPIIAVTALAMAGDRERCLEAGMDDYITKPIDRDLLAEKLNYWMNPGLAAGNQAKVVPIFDTLASPSEYKEDPINIGQFEEAYGAEAHELILLFVNSTEKLVNDLQSAFEQRDATTLARLAHEIKGSSWAVGAEEMARLAVFLEQAAGQQNWKLIHRTYARMRHHFDELNAFVQQRLAVSVQT